LEVIVWGSAAQQRRQISVRRGRDYPALTVRPMVRLAAGLQDAFWPNVRELNKIARTSLTRLKAWFEVKAKHLNAFYN
jgi:hypothetical protein